jgi:hypothetical protein
MPMMIDLPIPRVTMTTEDVATFTNTTEAPPAVIPPARTRPGKRCWVGSGLQTAIPAFRRGARPNLRLPPWQFRP